MKNIDHMQNLKDSEKIGEVQIGTIFISKKLIENGPTCMYVFKDTNFQAIGATL